MDTSNTSKKTILVITILVPLALISLYFAFNMFGWDIAKNLNLVSGGTENMSNNNQASALGLPTRLTIPSINVDAQVINVGLAKDGTVGVPEGPYQVAWFELGPRPGQTGSAIITGHFGPWKSGASSVFDNLNKLAPGDKIYVHDDNGTVLTFAVRETKTYNPDQSVPEVFDNSSGIHLNLITCNGDWVVSQKTYTQRLVVFTDEVVK